MKGIIVIILFTIMLSVSYSDEILNISKEILISTEWGPDERGEGIYLKFYEDNSFFSNCRGEGCEKIHGEYEIKDNIVLLKPKEYVPNITNFTFENVIWKLKYKKSDPTFRSWVGANLNKRTQHMLSINSR